MIGGGGEERREGRGTVQTRAAAANNKIKLLSETVYGIRNIDATIRTVVPFRSEFRMKSNNPSTESSI